MLSDTICALATPAGGAIGLIRVSGPQAIPTVDTFFQPAKGKKLSQRPSHTSIFGTISQEATLDEVLVTLFRAPHSYTGEDIVEISCHGSTYILTRVLEILISQGCRQAEPGEFTKRAFLNGKMDLSQAEAVADLIASTTQSSHQIALRQLRGDYSSRLRALREQLLQICALLELELDFSDHEDIQFADRSQLQSLVAQLLEHIKNLCESFRLGNALKRGILVVIVGQTNVGKSTLLNALLSEQRAIVSPIHGTTRDTIEATQNISGHLFRFIDTAGLRSTSDPIEQMGIERTLDSLQKAEIVVWLLDATNQPQAQYNALAPQILPAIHGKPLILLLNKADLAPTASVVQEAVPFSAIGESRQEPLKPTDKSPSYVHSVPQDDLPSSNLRPAPSETKSPTDVAWLKNKFLSILQNLRAQTPQEDIIVSSIRHFENLTRAGEALERVILSLQSQIPSDLVCQDLREASHYLGEILGEVTSDDILQHIFSRFCVGK